MNESYLHYLWVNKKIPFIHLQTAQKESLEILNFGQYLQLSGPDIFNAQIRLNKQVWAGNIEIHVKSSDWYLHNHEMDQAYDNVILHVVWEHDTPVFRSDNSEVSTLELKSIIQSDDFEKYKNLIKPKKWINCEDQLVLIDKYFLDTLKEKLFIERLERKATEIEFRLSQTSNNWEQVFFELLAKNFGLNTNGNAFQKMLEYLTFNLIRKERNYLERIEALFFGSLNLLEAKCDDTYFKELKFHWNYFKVKYQISELTNEQLSFFKHRPDNFPTIRLAQFAQLIFSSHNLFDSIIKAKSINDFRLSFDMQLSEYWQSHYNFCKSSTKKVKKISPLFFNLLVVNTIIPVKFAFEKYLGNPDVEYLFNWMRELAAEKNSVVDKFKSLPLEVNNGFDSQALLQLKKNYCDKNKCLNCAVGLHILKK